MQKNIKFITFSESDQSIIIKGDKDELLKIKSNYEDNKFLNPAPDGAIIPILHLNGYKIANPTVFARISDEELVSFFKGCGYIPFIVSGYLTNAEG